ncbi:MAG TPA: hypothetical protein VEA38_05370 [Terriglobales bacterium]|nr:hypothetical protein [Terriglobales bacterium]
MVQFILGAVAGGVAAWWWRSDIQKYMDEKLPDMREKAADRLAAIEQRAEDALGKAKSTIDRMRPAGEGQHRGRDMSSTGRSGTYTQGSGV